MVRKLIINCATGERTECDLTPTEEAARETMRLEWETQRAAAAAAPDPDAELQTAIKGAGTLDELKAALLGKLSKGRAAGRAV